MKLIDSVKQSDGPGGTLEKWLLHNKLIITLCRINDTYEFFVTDSDNRPLTNSIYDKLGHPYNGLPMKYGGFSPPKITMQSKYFDKFVELAEKLDPEQLEEEPFSG